MATIKDVAKRAEVSPTTVSRVLNNTAPVNEKTKEKILAVMDELNYSPSIMAQGMRTKRSKTFGVVIPDYRNPFYHQLFHYLEEEAKKQGYHILVSSTGEENTVKETVEDLLHRNVDGLIVCTYQGERGHIKELFDLAKKLPMVFMDHLDTKRSVNAVYTDGYKGIYEITNHLIQLGHRRIGFVKPISSYHVAGDRYEGYKGAIEEAGLKVISELIFEGDYSIDSGYSAAAYYLSSLKNHPTAIVSSTDLMAVGIVKYIQSKGMKVPEDIAVSGFDNIYLSELITPSLTTYHQPIKQMARQVMDILMQKLTQPDSKPRQVILEGKLIIRNSTQP